MANFESAIKQTLIHEGGYNEVKGDAGGATNFGISLRFLKGLDDNLDLADINNDGKIDSLDIKNLTEEHAKKIYFEEFWKANKCDLLASVLVVWDRPVKSLVLGDSKLLLLMFPEFCC